MLTNAGLGEGAIVDGSDLDVVSGGVAALPGGFLPLPNPKPNEDNGGVLGRGTAFGVSEIGSEATGLGEAGVATAGACWRAFGV